MVVFLEQVFFTPMIEHDTARTGGLLESAKKVFGANEIGVPTSGGGKPHGGKLPSLRDIEAIAIRARKSEEMLARLKQNFTSECRSSLRQQTLNVRGLSSRHMMSSEGTKDTPINILQHVDPNKESDRHTIASSSSLLPGQQADEGALQLLQVVRSLRSEASSLSRALLESHPPGTFSLFFPPDSTIDAKGPLPPPPPVDQMLQDFDEVQRRRNAEALQATSRRQIDDEIAATSRQYRVRMLHNAEGSQRGAPCQQQSLPELPNPAEVLGLAPPAPAPIANQRAMLYLNELNAQLMLTYVMQAAAAMHDPTLRQQSASRGSSEETPSITPIASVADQSAVIPPSKKRSVVDMHQSDFLGPSAISASTILHNTPHTSVVKGASSGGGNAATVKGTAVQSTNQGNQSTKGEPVTAHESEESGSSGFSPRAQNTAHNEERAFNNRSKRGMDNSSIQLKETNRALNCSTMNNDATANTTLQLQNARESGSNTTSTTHHDTSTAATKGMSSPSPTSTSKRQSNESTSSSSHKKPASKVSWTDSQQGVERGSSQSSGTTIGSTKSKKKPKKGLFSCFRREESDDSDDEPPASDRADSIHSLQNASE